MNFLNKRDLKNNHELNKNEVINKNEINKIEKIYFYLHYKDEKKYLIFTWFHVITVNLSTHLRSSKTKINEKKFYFILY